MKAVLAMLSLALVAVIGWQWRDWPPPRPQSGAEDAASAEVQTAKPLQENPLDLLTPFGEKDEYAVVIERPLFLPDRRPPSEEPPPEEAAPEPEKLADLDRLDLNAVMITPAASLAWIRDPSQKSLIRLEPGDDLLGWSVQEILSDRVLLQRQGATDTLILRDYKNMSPPQPRRQRQSERTRPRQTPKQANKRPPAARNPRQPGVGVTNPRQPAVNRPSRMNRSNPPQQR